MNLSHPPCGRHAEGDPAGDKEIGSSAASSFMAMSRLGLLLKTRRYEEFREELARAEIAEEITEFHALNFQAILAMVEGSEHASDYLEMAEAVAASLCERAVLAESQAAHDLLHGNPFAAAERCLAAIDHVCQTEKLWCNLLIALNRLGEVKTIDAMLRSLARLDGECTARLMRLLLSESDLHDIRTRLAFKELLGRRATA